MLNVASVFSRLGNPNSLIPLAIKDSASTAGMTIGSYITGKEEGHDRFIDEVGTEVIWLGGIPFFKWLFDKTVFKSMGLDSKFDARNLKDDAIFQKAKEYSPTNEIKQNIEKISKNKKTFKNVATSKFLVSTALTVASYIGLTKFKQKYTEKKIRENLIAEYQAEQKTKKENKEINTVKNQNNISFKGLSSVVESLAFSPVKNMWVLDGCITAERLKDSRTKQEFIGYAIKEASILTFMYYAGGKIQNLLEEQASKKGKSIALDARVIENDFLKNAFEDGSIIKSLEEFKAVSNSKIDLYEFLHKKPNNIVVKTAKMSDVIELYKEPQGLFKKAKVTDKIDTRKYIDIDEVKSIGAKLEELYSNYKTALSKGESSEKFFESVKTLKRKSIITNIGTCILALGVVTPAIMLAKRLTDSNNTEFQTKKEIREQLIKEGLIA